MNTERSRSPSGQNEYKSVRYWAELPLPRKRKILFIAILVLAFIATALKIAAIRLHCLKVHPFRDGWVGLMCSNLGVTIIIILGFTYWYFKLHQEPVHRKPTLYFSAARFFLLVLCIYVTMSSVIGFVHLMDLLFTDDIEVDNLAALVAVDAVLVAFDVIFAMCAIIYMWWPEITFWRAWMIVVSVLQFIDAFVCILVNVNRLISSYSNLELTSFSFVRSYPQFALIIGSCALWGFSLACTVDEKSRLSALILSFYAQYCVLTIIALMLSIAWLAMSIRGLHFADDVPMVDIYIANPILAGFAILTLISGLIGAYHRTKRPDSRIRIEEYDLSNLTPLQLDAWAILIDNYSCKLPGATKGQHALDLMKAYVASPTGNMRCKVIRAYDSSVSDSEYDRFYEHTMAWSGLDQNKPFDIESLGKSKLEHLQEAEIINPPQKLSKRAQRKMERKGNAPTKDKRQSVMAIETKEESVLSQEALEREAKFKAELMSTEALILFTTVDNYNLTATLGNSRFAKFIDRMFGASSYLNLLSIRIGLLATHWPFRQACFFTAPTRKPNARTAAVLRAVAAWNSALPREQRCTLIVDPACSYDGNDRAFDAGGWLTTSIPPSHVVDLRPYRGKTIQQYLKAIKYRNQSSAFKSANGVVIETQDFSRENCEIVMNLWRQIAERRDSNGQTSNLSNPDVDFLMRLGSAQNNPHGNRRLLFLKVGDEYIASCILFILGDTITSDIQGLNGELARQYKAYFVMMQETISLALQNGNSFVDFGPTTSKPKMDIGCSEVALVGGMYADAPLRWGIGAFTSQVTVE